jgi:hypothetical protein
MLARLSFQRTSNLASITTGEITAARHPEAARESNQGLATARALGLNAPLFYELRPELHAGWLPGADLFGADQGIGARGGMPPASVVPVGENQVSRPDTRQAVRSKCPRTSLGATR